MNDVIDLLTHNGTTPIHFNVLWKGGIHIWDPGSQCILIRSIRDQALAARCREYLVSVGADFVTMDQLREWAVRHGWPNAEELPDLSEDED
jgi:hypothetical protein